MKSFRRVASSHRFKESEQPHSCTSFPYVHYKLCSKLRSKRRLRVQSRPAGCVLSRTGYLHRQGISVIPYLDDWLVHHPDCKVLLGRLYPKQKEIRAGPDTGSPVSRHCLHLDLGEASLPQSKAWEIVAHARHLCSLRVLSYTQVSHLMGSLNWASGLIHLGRLYLRPLQCHFHSLGLTNRFMPPRR